MLSLVTVPISKNSCSFLQLHDTNAAYERLKHLADDYHHYVSLRPKTDFVFEGSNALISLLSM